MTFPENEISNIISDYIQRTDLAKHSDRLLAEIAVNMTKIKMRLACSIIATAIEANLISGDSDKTTVDMVANKLDKFKVVADETNDLSFDIVKQAIIRQLKKRGYIENCDEDFTNGVATDETKH